MTISGYTEGMWEVDQKRDGSWIDTGVKGKGSQEWCPSFWLETMGGLWVFFYNK